MTVASVGALSAFYHDSTDITDAERSAWSPRSG